MFLLLFFVRHQQLGENHTDWPNYWASPLQVEKKPHSRIGAGTSPCTTTLQGQSRGSPFLHLIILKSWDVGRWGESGEAGWRPVADGEIPQILPLIPRSRRRNKLHEHPLGQALILPAQPPDCPNCSYPGCACFGLAASFTAPSSNNQY